MLEVKIPTEEANSLIKAGKFEHMLQSILGDIRPEAAYFSDMDGCRGGWIVVNLDDASQIPGIAEPFFIGMNASLDFHPVMLPEDLARGSDAFQRATEKYG